MRKGINLGPGSTGTHLETDHWWFLQWEQRGDFPLRYFVEPVVLTTNYATKQGYDSIHMAGLSGGGWTTTVAPAVDERIVSSFPIAGSVPCAMRNSTGRIPGQKWTGNDDEDYEQSCRPYDDRVVGGDNMPGRRAFSACNYTWWVAFALALAGEELPLRWREKLTPLILLQHVPPRGARADAIPSPDLARIRQLLLLAARPA